MSTQFIDISAQQILNDMQKFPKPWAVCGGWAIDIYLNRKTREHKDLDITIHRCHQLDMQAFLVNRGWILQKVESVGLEHWALGEYLELPIHNVWCSHSEFTPNYLEVLYSETTETNYVFRRHQDIQMPLDDAFLIASSGIPILAPEVVLLFKAKTSENNPDYQHDFDTILPTLTSKQRMWLKQSIVTVYKVHEWLKLL